MLIDILNHQHSEIQSVLFTTVFDVVRIVIVCVCDMNNRISRRDLPLHKGVASKQCEILVPRRSTRGQRILQNESQIDEHIGRHC